MIDNLPKTYTPGTSFSFDLSLPALTDFTDYTLNLVFSTNTVDPPLFASSEASANYPFATSSGFQSTLSRSSSSSQITLTIADSTSSGVTVTPGSNDALAHVTVTPGADMTGPIHLSVGVGTVFHYNSEDFSYDFPTNIPAITEADVGSPPTAVPAPPGALLLGFGVLILGLRARRSA
jgi:hypothetical protein